MKTKGFLITGLCLLMMAGCQDEQYEMSSNDGLVRVYADAPSITRVTYSEEGNVVHASWDEGDRIGVYTDDQHNLEYTYSSQNGEAEFRANNEPLKSVEGTKVYAYYHYDGMDYDFQLPMRDPVMRWDRPFLYAQGEIRNNEVHLQFKHAFAFLKLTVTLEAIEPYIENPVLTQINVGGDAYISISENARFDIRTEEFILGPEDIGTSTGNGVDNHSSF